MSRQPAIEGVDFEIITATVVTVAGRDFPSGWVWRCLKCGLTEFGQWSDPNNARTSYSYHDCACDKNQMTEGQCSGGAK